MEDNRRSFKRHPIPFSETGGNKRGKFSDQSSEIPETVYRILCPQRKIGGVIGKGGGIIKSLREETQAKITVADPIPGSDERIIIIYSHSTKKPLKQITDDMELQCASQDALLKVNKKILEEDGVIDNQNVVTARLLVPHHTVGCLLGKKGDVIKRLRSETGANIRVLPADQLPVCATSTDELVQISAKPAILKRALYEVSTLLHQNPRKDQPVLGHQPFRQMKNLPPPPLPNPSPRGGWRGDFVNDPRFGSVEFDGGETPADFSMKILCSREKIGGVIGKGGSNIRQLQQETGTDIHVDDVAADSDERVISVSSFEVLMNPRSRTIDAILVLQDQTSDHSEKGIVTTRLLLPSSKVGCILGQGGQVINEMRRRTKADIRVYSKDEKPRCAGKDEELVQVSGVYSTVKDALGEIASRYRARCLREAKPAPVERPSGGGRPGGSLPGGGRPGGGGYEVYSRLREHDPYSHEASSRDYEPPHGYRGLTREYESNSYGAPHMGYEPRGYPSPIREGYFSSRFSHGVDLKMTSSGRASAIGNASEITGTRPNLQDLYGAGSQSSIGGIHSSSHLYDGPKRPLQSSYAQEPYPNINPSSLTNPPPYNHYNYSDTSYKY